MLLKLHHPLPYSATCKKRSLDCLISDLDKRYVDTLAKRPGTEAVPAFLSLNGLHPSMEFAIELPISNKIPFIGIEILKSATRLDTQI